MKEQTYCRHKEQMKEQTKRIDEEQTKRTDNTRQLEPRNPWESLGIPVSPEVDRQKEYNTRQLESQCPNRPGGDHTKQIMFVCQFRASGIPRDSQGFLGSSCRVLRARFVCQCTCFFSSAGCLFFFACSFSSAGQEARGGDVFFEI